MFGRKARQIANQAIMIATARKESHDHLSQIVDKNKKIIELSKALQEAERQLEVERNELRQADQKVHRAESAADAAIQAAGIISDQLRAAQAALAEKETVIQQLLQSTTEKSRNLIALTAKVDRLAEALRQARAQLDSARLIDKAIEAKTDTPALQALREEIAKVREGDVEVVYELPQDDLPFPQIPPLRTIREEWEKAWSSGEIPMPLEAYGDPLPKRTPGASLSHGFTDHGHPCCDEAPRKAPPNTKVHRCGGTRMCTKCRDDRDRWHSLVPGGVVGQPAEVAKETTP